MGALRQTADERIEAKQTISKFYTCEDIGTIWKYARGLDRLLILCGMNYGFAQSEILNMMPEDISGETTCAIRGKSSVLRVWPVWEETRQYAQYVSNIPSTAQGISNTWNKLIARVQKNEPEFRRLSFKWLRTISSASKWRPEGTRVWWNVLESKPRPSFLIATDHFGGFNIDRDSSVAFNPKRIYSWQKIRNRTPMWFLLVMFAIPATFQFAQMMLVRGMRMRRHRAGFCPACGYDLRESSDKCPECGRKQETEE